MRRLPHRTSVTPLLAGLLLGLLAIVVLQGCANNTPADASATAATPLEAIGILVQERGERFAGLCEQTRSPDDIGKVCSRLIEERDGLQAHLIGRTFSEFSTWVFVSQRDGGWTIVATTPLDFHDVTGTVPWP